MANLVKILFDPGHSLKKEGALSVFGIGEHELNLIQARAAYKALKQAGFELTIYDPANDDLLAIGKEAKLYDAFISIHLNASSNKEANYVTCCLHEVGAKTASKSLAIKILCELVKELQIPAYKGPLGPGMMYLPLKVLSLAEKACKGPCVLTEAFFMSSSTWKSKEELISAAERAGVSIAKAVIGYFANAKRN